jgi:hypothetical protein
MLTQYYVCVGLMRGVLLVRGLGANLYSIGTATDTGIEVFFSNNTVSFTRNGVVLMEGERAGKTLYHLNIRAKHFPVLGEKSRLFDRTMEESILITT